MAVAFGEAGVESGKDMKIFSESALDFAARWKYAIEGMAESIYEKYGVERNRIPTDAELELVAYCFGVSRQEALSILSTRKLRTAARLSPGDVPARKD